MEVIMSKTTPIPAKPMLAAMGLITPTLRLPLVPMGAANRQRMLAAFGEWVEVQT